MVCPTCGASLKINVHPNQPMFHVRCMVDTTHLSMHDTADSKPSWWAQYVSDGWY